MQVCTTEEIVYWQYIPDSETALVYTVTLLGMPFHLIETSPAVKKGYQTGFYECCIHSETFLSWLDVETHLETTSRETEGTG